jgi:RNA polymerase sigma-70 factor, ECF subfamily
MCSRRTRTEKCSIVSNGVVTQAFATVAEKYRQQIFRFLLASSRDVDLAETLTQECFLKAYCKWSTFRVDSSAKTWLMRIAINLQKDHWRSQRIQFWRHVHTNSVDVDIARDWLPSADGSPEAQAVAHEQIRRVWKAVKEMSPQQKTAFLLRFVEDLDLREISSVTGLCVRAAKAQLYRALKISPCRVVYGKVMSQGRTGLRQSQLANVSTSEINRKVAEL